VEFKICTGKMKKRPLEDDDETDTENNAVDEGKTGVYENLFFLDL
jgi:hypothetical protein